MKVSELIDELQDYQEYYGDQEISIWSDYTGTRGRIIDLSTYSNELVINIDQDEV